ncbi:methyltransferase [Porticoccus sp. W117]|uniref:methyltransferase n=1 Tax=Porticoccus sp. W117 TaxID=3054777 RepID=UPI0025949A82|nr:methyltransferase [Porticoccus sp. W117]MDM3871137.1 methyltransferase [Porticoccus sp. W117]
MEIYQSPFGPVALARYPKRRSETLRAWDAADEYLINHIVEQQLISSDNRLLILNDSFGALAVTLCTGFPELQLLSTGDSWLSQRGAEANMAANHLTTNAVNLCHSLEWPERGQTFKLVIIKIPKSLSLLEDQLHRLQPYITDSTTIVAATMAKHLHNSHLQLFEKLIGTTKTSQAKKKARLAFISADSKAENSDNPYPKSLELRELNLQLQNHANVFSRDGLDIGSRFFLQNLPRNERYRTIIDLGSGNGLLGIVAAQKNPAAEIIFTDESFMAVASAKHNFSINCPNRVASFQVTDCLQGIEKNSADLILCNPPFHQQNTITTHIAEQMFRESKQVLKTGGELWVIGNRHLGYHVKLKRLFGNCQTAASNNKFVILQSVVSKN